MSRMYKVNRRHGIRPTPIDLAPLVDVALILVVFLLLSGQGQAARIIEVALPNSDDGSHDQPALPSIAIAPDGTLSSSFADIGSFIIQDIPNLFQGQTTVILLADKNATHGRVVEVEDALRQAGVGEVFYATQSRLDEW